MAMITHQQWFDTFMLGHGLFMSNYDSCVYFKKHLDGSFVYLLLYVDDMLNVFKNMSEINSLKDQLSGEFEMKDLKVANKILGNEIRINRSIDKLYLL
jgi:methyl coenzyme M reductase alpha subunit